MAHTIHLPKNTTQKRTKSHVIEKAKKAKKIIILSPHLDDAVVSMGSFLSYVESLNIPTHIVSVFTKGADVVHVISQILINQGKHKTADGYFKQRVHEDKKVLATFKNIKNTHLNFIDCVWRSDEKGNIFYTERYLGDIHKDDVKTMKSVIEELQKLDVKDAVIFVPLAHGKHIDHQIVRDAATEIFPEVIYYSDFPYSQMYDHEHEFIKKHNLQSEAPHTNNYEKKRDLIMEYKSQHGSLFKRGDLQLVLETFYFK